MRAANDDVAAGYAELHCLSDFSFQRGASTAAELFARAKEQGYAALAITDECTLAGAVRALMAAEKFELPLIVGSEMRIEDGPRCVLLVESKAGYSALCGLITDARRRAAKGAYRLLASDFDRPLDGLLALWLPGDEIDLDHGRWLAERFRSRCWMAVELHCGPDDATRLRRLQLAARELGLRCVAAGDVHMHARARRELQDVMTAIRLRTPLKDAGYALFPNGERHLRSRAMLASIYPQALLDETLTIAARCTFHLKHDHHYDFPHELVPSWHTPTSWLRHLVKIGLRRRWKERAPEPAHRARAEWAVEHELALIEKLGFEKFFLTVYDVVWFARRKRKILCQGRGSAANSAVCYALGITELRPGHMDMLFERFISESRANEPPDIDVDFEHERREEVLQYVFNRYGRRRAALAAVVISYRGRSAVRDVGRALGLPEDQIGEIAKTMDRWSAASPLPEYLRENGFDPDTLLMRKLIELTGELVGMPRHLSQHPGGFLIAEDDLATVVPVENAAMDDRTVAQWDKDDIEYMGMLKVDCLALGMLTCIRKTFDVLRQSGRRRLDMAYIAGRDHTMADGRKVFEMIRAADSIGVFQIESRAQMSMAPRLKPEKFYDLVIQIAIVRPGPIQGNMVQPYLKRKMGQESVTYASEALVPILERTLGVPLFQEQVMQIAITAAGYSPAQADVLRRSMAAWKKTGDMERHRAQLTEGLLRNGYSEDFARSIFEQIRGFGSYGFPESHAASFALLCWQSAWLKCHEPAAFAAGLLNSQPMGFYSPSQIVQDLRRHRIEVCPVDIRFSEWDCTLEFHDDPANLACQPALRLGMRLINGFNEACARRIVAARRLAAFSDAADLCKRASLDMRERNALADSGALRGLLGHRHKARWLMAGVESRTPLLDETLSARESQVALPMPRVEDDMRTDYATLGLTLGRHPLSLLRSRLARRGLRRSRELPALPNGTHVAFAGIVTLRQRPGTANDTTFVTLEDEDGLTNIVVWKRIAERDRRALLSSRLVPVRGHLGAGAGVQHLVAKRLENLDAMLGHLDTRSRDFH